jgi:hypothetical protein
MFRPGVIKSPIRNTSDPQLFIDEDGRFHHIVSEQTGKNSPSKCGTAPSESPLNSLPCAISLTVAEAAERPVNA